jgi:putative membrane protein
MSRTIRKIAGAALGLAVMAPAAWADSPVAGSVASGAGNFQGPGWNGYGGGPWMMGGGWGGGMPMMGYGGWGGYGGGGWLMMLFGAVITVALLVFIFRALAWTTHAPHHHAPYHGGPAAGLQALDERYARGEIPRDEYLQKKRDILGA